MTPQAQQVYIPSSLYVTSTLVIGLGGTGVGVIRQLKRRIRSSMNPMPGVIEFLAVDTEMPQNMPGDERIFDREIAYIGDFNAGRVLDHLEQYPHIKDWWPTGQVVSGMIFRGARQRRLVGRLSLYVRWGEFARKLDAKLDKVRQIAEREAVEQRGIQVERTRQVRVYIVSSLCGGTGSGLLLDVAFRVRNALGDDAEIYGVFVMPSAFLPEIASHIQRLRIQGNAYAALKEIDHFLSGEKEFEASFPDYAYQTPDGVKQSSRVRRPFNTVFLVDRDNGKEPLGNLEEVRQLISQAIFLDLLTPLGKEVASKRENMNDLASEQRGQPSSKQPDLRANQRTLGIAGVTTASLVLPALDVVVDQVALRLMQNQVLRKPDDKFIKEKSKKIIDIVEQVLGNLKQPTKERIPSQDELISSINEQLQAALISIYLAGGLHNTSKIIASVISDLQSRSKHKDESDERVFERFLNIFLPSEEKLKIERKARNRAIRNAVLTHLTNNLSSLQQIIDDRIKQLQPWYEDRLAHAPPQCPNHSPVPLSQPPVSSTTSKRHQAHLFELVTVVGYEQEILPPGQAPNPIPPIRRYLDQFLTKEEEQKLIEEIARCALFDLEHKQQQLDLNTQQLNDPIAAYLKIITNFVRPIVSQRATILSYLKWFYDNIVFHSNTSTKSQGSPIDPLRQLKLRCVTPFLNIDNAKLGTEHQHDIEYQPIIGYSPLRTSAQRHDPDDVLADFDSYSHIDTGVFDRLDVLVISYGYRITDLSGLDDLKKAYDYFMKTQQETLHVHKEWHTLRDIV